jgi:hypothetical protein
MMMSLNTRSTDWLRDQEQQFGKFDKISSLSRSMAWRRLAMSAVARMVLFGALCVEVMAELMRPAAAQSVEEFYRSKPINLILGFSTGELPSGLHISF